MSGGALSREHAVVPLGAPACAECLSAFMLHAADVVGGVHACVSSRTFFGA
jgi:hypothetical protein